MRKLLLGYASAFGILAAAGREAGGGTGTDPGPDLDQRLAAAIDQLDHKRDALWTADGRPAVPALVDLLQHRITRADVERVRPGFMRTQPPDGGEKVALSTTQEKAEAQGQMDTKHAIESVLHPTATDASRDRHARTDVADRSREALDDETSMFRDGGPVWRGLSPRRIYQRRRQIIEALETLNALTEDTRGAPGELVSLRTGIGETLTSMKRFPLGDDKDMSNA